MTDLTISVSDDVADTIAAEARTRGVSPEDLAREVIERRWGPKPKRVLRFAALGEGSPGFSAARADELLEAEGFGSP